MKESLQNRLASVKEKLEPKIYIDVQKAAVDLSDNCNSFCENAFQTLAATQIVSSTLTTTVAILPTGTGKTFVAAIIAKYYQKRSKKAVIVTSHQLLVNQFEDILEDDRTNIEILTMEQVLLQLDKHEVFVVDEVDCCVMEKGSIYDESSNKIFGF